MARNKKNHKRLDKIVIAAAIALMVFLLIVTLQEGRNLFQDDGPDTVDPALYNDSAVDDSQW